MYHSITYDTKNTWDDWHLIPTQRPSFNVASPIYNFVSVPGRSGSLDLTDVYGDEPVYDNITGSHTFIIENGFKPWHVLKSEISNYLDGRRIKAILEDDPSYYYEGRFNVSGFRSESAYSLISISYNVEPFKKSVVSSMDDWLWDPFDFEKDTILQYKDMIVSGSMTTDVYVKDRMIIPEFICSSPMTLELNGKSYKLNAGSNRNTSISFNPGATNIKVIGNGTISINYRDISL